MPIHTQQRKSTGLWIHLNFLYKKITSAKAILFSYPNHNAMNIFMDATTRMHEKYARQTINKDEYFQ